MLTYLLILIITEGAGKQAFFLGGILQTATVLVQTQPSFALLFLCARVAVAAARMFLTFKYIIIGDTGKLIWLSLH